MDKKTFNIHNLDLYSLSKDLLYGLWIIIMIGAIGTMVTYSYIKDSYEPQYSSSAIYVVTPRQSTGYVYTNKRFAENVISVFQNLLDADIMKNRIKKELHIDMKDVNMNVELITETNLMKVTVVSGNPVKSFQIIGSIMDNYNELSEYLNSDAVIDTLRAPVVSTHPDNALMPRSKSIETGMICAFVAALILAALSIMRKTLKTEDAVEEQLGTTLLGSIYHERKNRTFKAKIAQKVKVLLITSPIISTRFIESINNIRVKMEYEHERNPEKNVYMVTSVCENEGKSTVALNLALSFAGDGKKVIIIDADMRKPAICKMLDIPKDNVVDMIKLLQGDCGLDEVLYHEEKLSLDIIMSTKGHSSTHEYVKSGAMKDLVRKCSKMADYVILDTPPMAMVSDAEALCDVVDFVSIVVRYDYSYEKDIEYSINLVNDSNAKLLGCILNNYKTFGNKSGIKNFGYDQSSERAVEVYDE